MGRSQLGWHALEDYGMMEVEEESISLANVDYITYRTSRRLYTDLFFSMYAWTQAEGANYRTIPYGDEITEEITVVCHTKCASRYGRDLGKDAKLMTSYVR
jgi:hypothetical protein